MENYIYFNNAATSWPKPPEVIEAMKRNLTECPVFGDRQNIASAKDVVKIAREEIASLFEAPDSNRIVFGSNASELLNAIIHGTLKSGDHAISTYAEHNSVIRPLNTASKRNGVELTYVRVDERGYLDIDDFSKAFKDNTRLVVINHGSNVTGALQDIKKISDIAFRHKVPLLLDASQTAGNIKISLKETPVAYLVFTGHKALFGPRGIGGAYIAEGFDFPPFKQGGTGILSEDPFQPERIPVRYETGTRNVPGIVGLTEGVRFVKKIGISKIIEKKHALLSILIDAMKDNKKIILYSPDDLDKSVGTISFAIKNWLIDDIGYVLTNSFNIIIRTGLHCAPMIHEILGTLPIGTARISLSYFNSEEEVERLIKALNQISVLK
ncbi:MAG: aminotransferase class V-fold PLP-dependent enzyme [Candidatus Coatesbacteria bacterium]|nr:aminotransferase class V-fold PLP-dependent enzyme [Candidatus Coatesbacteria bacterium]